MHIGSFLFGLFTGISCGIVCTIIFIGWIYVIRHNENYKSSKKDEKLDVIYYNKDGKVTDKMDV